MAILVLLAGTFVLTNVRNCPCLALGTLCKDLSDPQLVAVSTRLSYP